MCKTCKIENNATTNFNKRIFDFTFKTGEIKQSVNQYSNPNKDKSCTYSLGYKTVSKENNKL